MCKCKKVYKKKNKHNCNKCIKVITPTVQLCPNMCPILYNRLCPCPCPYNTTMYYNWI